MRTGWLRDLVARRAAVLAALALAAFVVAALFPFRWAPPRRLVNDAQEIGHGYRFHGVGAYQTEAAPPWVARAIETGSLRLRLRVRSDAVEQYYPRRILTLSRDVWERNLLIGQEGPDLVVRLRTPRTTANGTPPFVVRGVFAGPDVRAIDCTIAADRITLAVDGRVAVDEPLPAGALRSWDPTLPLVLGNEGSWNRGWRGEILEATVDGGPLGALAAPPSRWVGLKFEWWGEIQPLDIAINLFGFLPIGYLLALARGRRIGFAVLVTAVVCLAVESAQLGFVSRMPSARDWLLNVLGAFLGALTCATARRSSEGSAPAPAA